MVLVHISTFSQNNPVFKPLRYNDNFTFLRKDTTNHWYKKLKHSPLTKHENTYISFGGDLRFQYFYATNEGWGDEPEDKDGYFLARCLLHADVHSGMYFRTYAQLQSSSARSRLFPNAIDNNALEIHQAFVDIHTNQSLKNKVIIRAGRQEFLYGSQRLVSVREGPNNRQSFDALRVISIFGPYQADVFYSHYVQARKQLFDDRSEKNVQLWGAYIARNKLSSFWNIDFYYLGLKRMSAMFDDGKGKETRHSIGCRIWQDTSKWKYDIEALYQFGKFTEKNISAWTASLSTSYNFDKTKWKPEVGLKAELISGDRRYDDNRLQTFNPLFPRGAYFGLAALIGPSNLFDLHPSLTLNPINKLSLEIDYDIFWRYSLNDGLYAVNTSLVYSGRNTNERNIGNQSTFAFVYKPNRYLYFRVEFTWFNSGQYLKAAGTGKDILFTGMTTQLKF